MDMRHFVILLANTERISQSLQVDYNDGQDCSMYLNDKQWVVMISVLDSVRVNATRISRAKNHLEKILPDYIVRVSFRPLNRSCKHHAK